MLATLCLLGGMLVPAQVLPPGGPSQGVPPRTVQVERRTGPAFAGEWLLTPRLVNGQELVYRGTYTEQTIAGVAAPAHVEVIDFDKDGDLDLLVAALGFLFPNNNRVGSVIVLENDGRQTFTSHYIADRVARVADARAADFDGDGDLDVAVAGFGYDDGETSWLENRGQWKFEQHVLQRL